MYMSSGLKYQIGNEIVLLPFTQNGSQKKRLSKAIKGGNMKTQTSK